MILNEGFDSLMSLNSFQISCMLWYNTFYTNYRWKGYLEKVYLMKSSIIIQHFKQEYEYYY